MNDNFCIFILTHGRPDNVLTLKTLKRQGYTGKVYIVIDNEDETAPEYYRLFGNKVIIFDKEAISKTFDNADNFNNRKTIVYARNACFSIAKELGIPYFMQLDDDYKDFNYRIDSNKDYALKTPQIKSLDRLFTLLLKYYQNTTAKAICIAQGGDFIGGAQGTFAKMKLSRKAMNSFICSTLRPFTFFGRINEDVNTYTYTASTGNLFITIPFVSLNQKQTQSNKGGMTDTYLESGTYIKSFYTILFHPSSVVIRLMGDKHKRLHHHINWNKTVPKIIDEKHKKYE